MDMSGPSSLRKAVHQEGVRLKRRTLPRSTPWVVISDRKKVVFSYARENAGAVLSRGQKALVFSEHVAECNGLSHPIQTPVDIFFSNGSVQNWRGSPPLQRSSMVDVTPASEQGRAMPISTRFSALTEIV